LVRHDRGDETKEYDEKMWVPSGCNVLIRREVFSRHGLYSTMLGYYSSEAMIYGEDSEIMFRFKKAGEKLLYYPKALVYHPADESRINKTRFRRWYWGSGRGRVRWMDVTGNPVRYANVPRYVLKEAALELARFVISLPSRNKAKKFFHEMALIHLAGMIFEHYVEGN
jgi:GT2 family glycosyltransferase